MVPPRILTLLLLLVLATSALAQDTATNATNLPVGSCTATIPCKNGACCNGNSGFCGFGPDFCTATGNGGNCTSNCGALAECGQFAAPENVTCPLNVCCSQFGFCGTTDEFCGTGCQGSNCGQPSAPSCGTDQKSAEQRRIGYYEGWANTRPCMAYPPEQIDATVLTHINFAFALISSSFQLIPMSPGDQDLWLRTTNLKVGAPQLKVFLSVGGWSFNDPPTQNIFSNLVASSANINTFVNSAISVLEQYGFDGMDIDWEYPAAYDRGGVPADKENYVTFMKSLKSAFGPRGYGLSFTAPSSYWYLQHFDLPGLLQAADWVNLMSYDLHGTWDGVDPYIGYVLGAHTNLTEIDQALQLFWRVGINPGDIVLGMGFYGRSFTLADPSCTDPPCPWVSGGNPGPCSQNSGTLMFTEIEGVLSDPTATVSFDEVAAVKYAVWDTNQWVSYDDGDTFSIKMNYANDHCLGGTMVWSVDQDDSQYTALSDLYPDVTGVVQGFNESGDQCQITSCGTKSCGNWVSVADVTWNPGTQSTCPSNNKAKLCCPPANAPTKCTWRGGDTTPCNPSCNPGEAVLALDDTGDGKTCTSGYKALCCQTDFESLSDSCMITGCEGSNTCPSDHSNFITSIVKGNGQYEDPQDCIIFSGRGPVINVCPKTCPGGQSKAFCCNIELPYENCAWAGTPPMCQDASCLPGQVQLLADVQGDASQPCANGLTRAYCCDPVGANFVPVPFDDIFDPSEVPQGAETFTVDVDPDEQNGQPVVGTGLGDEEDTPFGEVFIDSPNPNAVSSLSIQSDWVLTGCDAQSDQPQTVLAYCRKSISDPTSGCGHVFIGDAEHTIVKMPKNCGLGPWARVASLQPHTNQNVLSAFHAAQKPAGEHVYELHFDYNFAAIPEGNGPVYMRADVTDLPDYWDTVVDSPPERKRWLQERGLWKEKTSKRWWGPFGDWLNKMNTVEKKTDFQRTFSYNGQWTIFDQHEACEGPPAFESSMTISVSGGADLNTRYGFYLQGKIVPPSVDAAYVYFAADANAHAQFNINGMASVTYDSSTVQFAQFGFPGLYYPGLLTIGPSLVVEGYITGQLSIGGDITVNGQWSFPQIGFTLGKSSSDQAPPATSPTQSNLGVGEGSINWSVDLNGDMSIHLVPRVQLGIEILGGAILDAEVFVRADIYGGASISGSVSNTVAANFCFNPYFGVDFTAGITGNILFWEPQPLVWPLYSTQSFFPPNGYCFGSEPQKRLLMRSTLDGAPPKLSIESRTSHAFDHVPKPSIPHEAYIHQIVDGKEKIILPVRSKVLAPRTGMLSTSKRAVPFLPGSLFCPDVGQEIADGANQHDPYADLDENPLEDAFERRTLLNGTFHPQELRATTVATCANSANRINISPPAYSRTNVIGYFDLLNPGAANIDPTYALYPGAPVQGSNIYGREHVYELQMLSMFIDSLFQTPNLWTPAAGTAANFCAWANQYIVNTPAGYLGQGNTVKSRIQRCLPANTQASTDIAAPLGTSMVWLEGIANGAKASAIASQTIRTDKTFNNYDDHTQVAVARGIASVITYMNNGIVQNQFLATHQCVDAVWQQWYAAYVADGNVNAPNRAAQNYFGAAGQANLYRQWTFNILGNMETNLANTVTHLAGLWGQQTTPVPVGFAGTLRTANPQGAAQVAVSFNLMNGLVAAINAPGLNWRNQVL